jgi:hypothetical protein
MKLSYSQYLIGAGVACGEVAGLLDIPYLRQAHQRRQRIIEAVASAELDGRSTTPERLYSWLSDIPIEGRANLGGEPYAAALFQLLSDPRLEGPNREEVRTLLVRVRRSAGTDPIEAAAVLFRGRDAITSPSRLAYVLFLRKVLGPAEPPISRFLYGLQAAAQRSRPHFDGFMAVALHKGATQALSAARTLRLAVQGARIALAGDRTSSRIHGIADLLYAGHPLSYSEAARIFRISRVAAREHLLRLQMLGLAEIATRRKSGHIFVARDGLLTFAPPPLRFVEKPKSQLGVASLSTFSAEDRARLEEVSDDVLSRMADLDRLLARLAVPKTQ